MRSSRLLTISSLRRELSPTRTLKWPGRNRVQITCNTSGDDHVQHVMVRRDSSAIKFGRTEIAFILALFSVVAVFCLFVCLFVCFCFCFVLFFFLGGGGG